MLSRFFIDRPIFAWVIAIITMIAGTVSVLNLPIRQYPAIAPPTVGISTNYPGSSAQTLQDTVIQVIEQALNGIDNLTYITSEANSDGSASITLTFAQGTNPDTAQVQAVTSGNQIAGSVRSREDGSYRIVNLTPGTYSVVVTRLGFALKRVENVNVTPRFLTVSVVMSARVL